MEKKTKKRKPNIPYIISCCIFIGGLTALALYLLSLHTKETDFETLRRNIKVSDTNTKEEDYLKYYLIDGEVVQEEFKDLYLKNPDTIGWIKINGTNIDYPVLFNPDEEEYYLHKDFNKDYSFNGSIFAGAGTDIAAPSENIIIYGHHIIGKKMFGGLDEYESEEYYKSHKYITFDTLRQTGKYEVIAAFRTRIEAEDYEGFQYYRYTNIGEESFDEYVKNIKELTPYNIDTTAKYGEQLITLSTCAYHTSNGRFVVVAKRIDGKEVDLEKSPIETINTTKE